MDIFIGGNFQETFSKKKKIVNCKRNMVAINGNTVD